ncbi:MAG: VOC family protein, partial [Burkholderiaceae bacterium]
ARRRSWGPAASRPTSCGEAGSSALLTWAVRCDSLATACARVPDLGEILPMARGPWRWKITVPDDGALQWGGILPTALQWEAGENGAPTHPCEVLEDRGCELVRLDLSHPAAVLGTEGLVRLFRELRIVGPAELKPGPRELAAHIRTPRGDIVLR